METTKTLGKITVSVLADYILKHHGPMSHLKLQKLLYYCEAYHLAYFEESIIDEEFQAWVHGPVCVEVYHDYKDNSILHGDVAFNNSYDPELEILKSLTSSQKELVTDVLNELSQWSGLQLEASTHNELPWKEARIGFSPAEICNRTISKETMKAFYRQELNV